MCRVTILIRASVLHRVCMAVEEMKAKGQNFVHEADWSAGARQLLGSLVQKGC